MTRRVLFSLVAVITLLLAACGGDDASNEAAVERSEAEADDKAAPDDPIGVPSAEAVAFVQEAAANTGEVTSGRFEMVMALEGGTTEVELMRVEGAFDDTSGRSSTTMDLSGFLAFLSADDLGAGTTAEEREMAMSMFDEPWQVVTDGDTAYMRMAFFGALFGAGDSWIQFEDGENEFTGDNPFMDAGFSGDMIEALEGAGDVEELGTESVGGVDAVRYSVELDPELLAESAGDPEIAELAEGAAVIDVWVDGDGFVRKMEMLVDIDAIDDFTADMGTASTLDGDLRVTIELFDLGEPVDIELPDPAEIFTEDDLFGGLFGGLGSGGPGGGGFDLEGFDGFDFEAFDDLDFDQLEVELEAELDRLLEDLGS